MGRRGEALGCSISREPGGGECDGGSLPRGQRLLPTAQQFKGGGQPALSCSEAIDVTGPSTAIGDLAPCWNGIGQVAG